MCGQISIVLGASNKGSGETVQILPRDFAFRRCDQYQIFRLFSKTCYKQPLKRKTKNWFSRPIIT